MHAVFHVHAGGDHGRRWRTDDDEGTGRTDGAADNGDGWTAMERTERTDDDDRRTTARQTSGRTTTDDDVTDGTHGTDGRRHTDVFLWN